MLHACMVELGNLMGHMLLKPFARPPFTKPFFLLRGSPVGCLLPFALSPSLPPPHSPLPAPWGCHAPPPRVTPDVSPTGSSSERLQPP